MNDEELHTLLSEMRDDPLPPASLARVRVRVAERTQARSWPKWSFAILASAMAFLAVFAFLSWPVRHARKPEITAVVQAQSKAVEQTPKLQDVFRELPRPAHRPVRQVVTRQLPKTRDFPMVIRIETPDPNVVILLIGE